MYDDPLDQPDSYQPSVYGTPPKVLLAFYGLLYIISSLPLYVATVTNSFFNLSWYFYYPILFLPHILLLTLILVLNEDKTLQAPTLAKYEAVVLAAFSKKLANPVWRWFLGIYLLLSVGVTYVLCTLPTSFVLHYLLIQLQVLSPFDDSGLVLLLTYAVHYLIWWHYQVYKQR